MNPETQFWLTTVIATYGAILATISFIASVWLGVLELRRHKPRIEIKAGQGVLFNNGRPSESFIVVEAINTGGGPVVITGVGWLLSNSKKLQYLNPYLLELPHKLEERRKCTFYLPARWYREIEERNKIVHVFFQDETGFIWRGRVTKANRKVWEVMDNHGWKLTWNDELKIWHTTD